MSHYVIKAYGFECDVAGCDSNVETIPRVDTRNKLAESRKQIALPQDGWTFRNGLDICNLRDAAHDAARGLEASDVR